MPFILPQIGGGGTPPPVPTSNSTLTVQNLVHSARVYPEFAPIIAASGWGAEPALTIANDVMQKFLAQTLNWKFNRGVFPPFLTVPLQQDYVTNVTGIGWLEQGAKVDINSTLAGAGTGAAKPILPLETVRDLAQSSHLGNPFNVSFIPNSLATVGTWTPSTKFQTGYGAAQAPLSPIQQVYDASGNLLFINSASLNLTIQSPGFPNATPPGSPYGTTGTVQPDAGINPTPGTTLVDGTVTWTVGNPAGFALRTAPIPAVSGLTWLCYVYYQKKPPILTQLSQTIAPVPDELGYLFRQGFFAMLREHAQPGSRAAMLGLQAWEESLVTALRSGDREREDISMIPSSGLMGGGPFHGGMPVGPAWPFAYEGW